MAKWLAGKLGALRPDVILTTFNDVACLLLAIRGILLPELKVVSTRHLSISGPLRRATGVKRPKLPLIPRLSRVLLPSADWIVRISHQLEHNVREMLRISDQINVIHNPVLMPDLPERMAMPTSWPWRDDDLPMLIFVGRVSPEKRLDLLLSAFYAADSYHPGKLLILGDGSERDKVQREIIT